MNREIIVLAKSSKHNDYCIAGIDLSTGKWIRPISLNASKEGAIPLRDITYKNGETVQIFDIIKIDITHHKPTKAQPENYVYNPLVPWVKIDRTTLEEVTKFRGYDQPGMIFYNMGKEVSETELEDKQAKKHSLLFVNVKNSCVFVKTFQPGKPRYQFNFVYNNINYEYFKISDRKVISSLDNVGDGRYNHKTNLPVVFSLTGKYQLTGRYYKMVAQMFY